MIRTKKRRGIVCGGKNYVWYVLASEDRNYWDHLDLIEAGGRWETPFLHIISEDKRLILTIPLNAPTPYVVSKGAVFRSKPSSGRWERYLMPFELPESVTPRFVAEIIGWAERRGEATEVVYDGQDIAF